MERERLDKEPEAERALGRLPAAVRSALSEPNVRKNYASRGRR